MSWMRKHLSREDGFTLIELMVVVLIIAVLVAIAIPSFLGFRRSAQDRAAQSEVRNALLAEKGYYTENAAFTSSPTAIQTFEPSIVFDADPTVAVSAQLHATEENVCLTRTSDAGNTFSVWESATGGTWYGTDDLSAACPAEDAGGGPTGTTSTYTQGGWG